MDKGEHGARLRAAMARAGYHRDVVADATGAKVRTVTNWTSGTHMPDPDSREALRRLFPGYDDPGDPVENAIHASELTEYRRYELIAFYKRLLSEERESGSPRGRRRQM